MTQIERVKNKILDLLGYLKTNPQLERPSKYLRIVENLRKGVRQIVDWLLYRKKLVEDPWVFTDDLRNQEDNEYGVEYIASFILQYLKSGEVDQRSAKREKRG
jgi:hypothetical protein